MRNECTYQSEGLPWRGHVKIKWFLEFLNLLRCSLDHSCVEIWVVSEPCGEFCITYHSVLICVDSCHDFIDFLVSETQTNEFHCLSEFYFIDVSTSINIKVCEDSVDGFARTLNQPSQFVHHVCFPFWCADVSDELLSLDSSSTSWCAHLFAIDEIIDLGGLFGCKNWRVGFNGPRWSRIFLRYLQDLLATVADVRELVCEILLGNNFAVGWDSSEEM